MSDKGKDIILNKQRQIMASAELAAQETNDWQTIQAYMTRRIADIDLSPDQQAKLDRYQFIYNQFVSGKYTQQEVCDMVQSTFKLSYSQAMRDIRDSREIFSSSVNINKQFEIHTQLELNRMWTQMAVAANDLRAASQFDKNRAKLLSMLPEKEDSAADDFVPHINQFTFDPALLGLESFKAGELQQLLRDIRAQYPGKLDVLLGDVVDAEIISESGNEETPL